MVAGSRLPSPRGELGVYLGVGTRHGRRAFIVYSPRTSRVYATVDARFDETYSPFRTTNQRVYGQDYSPSIQLDSCLSTTTCRIQQ